MKQSNLFRESYTPESFIGFAIKYSYSKKGCTAWFSGDIAPVHVGYYERYYVDGLYLHYWDGACWKHDNKPDTAPHWRQVGDYPAWRGLLNKVESA